MAGKKKKKMPPVGAEMIDMPGKEKGAKMPGGKKPFPPKKKKKSASK